MGTRVEFNQRPFGYEGDDDRSTKRATALPIVAQIIGVARIIWTIQNAASLKLSASICAQLIVRGVLEFLMFGLFLGVVDSLMAENLKNANFSEENEYPNPVPMAYIDNN